jgi:putative membrane protein
MEAFTMRALPIASLVSLLLVSPAAAEFGNPGGIAAGTPMTKPGVPAPHYPNDADRAFAVVGSIGGAAEVEFGRIADNKAARSDTKAFARRMVADHGKANEKLATLARADKIDLPDKLDGAHQAMLATLKELSGLKFDIEYLRGQVADHQKTAQLMEYEIDSGQDADLAGFAKDTLPTVLEHLDMARDALAKAELEAAKVGAM